jgi:plasmid stabilization system protein ParE
MRVRLTVRAIADLEAINAYLEERSPAAARSVRSAISKKIERIADFPFAAPSTDEPGILELSVVRYPYKIYYEIEGDEIWIVHVRDARRQPWDAD